MARRCIELYTRGSLSPLNASCTRGGTRLHDVGATLFREIAALPYFFNPFDETVNRRLRLKRNCHSILRILRSPLAHPFIVPEICILINYSLTCLPMYVFNMHEFSNFMEYWGEKRKRSRKFACLDYRETWNNYESTKAISFFIRFRVGDACLHVYRMEILKRCPFLATQSGQ